MKDIVTNIQAMTIRDVMNTDCLDIDEILLSEEKTPKKKRKKKKDIRPLSELVEGMRGGD